MPRTQFLLSFAPNLWNALHYIFSFHLCSPLWHNLNRLPNVSEPFENGSLILIRVPVTYLTLKTHSWYTRHTWVKLDRALTASDGTAGTKQEVEEVTSHGCGDPDGAEGFICTDGIMWFHLELDGWRKHFFTKRIFECRLTAVSESLPSTEPLGNGSLVPDENTHCSSKLLQIEK